MVVVGVLSDWRVKVEIAKSLKDIKLWKEHQENDLFCGSNILFDYFQKKMLKYFNSISVKALFILYYLCVYFISCIILTKLCLF